KLIAVGGVVDAVTRTVPAIFEFANPVGNGGTGGALRLGMTAKAQIFSGGDKPAVLVPAGAVQDESGTQVIYVQTGGESFERRIVQTGARDGAHIAIVAGIEAGQRVVSQGAYLIRLSTSMAGPSGHGH
ncbi:MAG: efflux RND transporter periplasmic adaptor subunit, partial [Gammaproteobacteria bacterium]|nr:efflux RND transporter periplasmic adaptor subunit [Gammaproteobacteria bacterium]